jgi:hypothetical protein
MKAKSQLTKANQTKTKMENLARELQKVRNRYYFLALELLTWSRRTTKSYGWANLPADR